MNQCVAAKEIAFIDLAAQRKRLGDRIDTAIAAVLAHGQYIMGPEVATLERQLEEFAGVDHAISCSNGTDALQLVLMAWGVGPGDAVICPSFTFMSTAEVVPLLGATPVFVDVCPHSFNLDPDALESAITIAKQQALTPRVVIAVDLFGQPADYQHIEPIVARHGMKLICDAAQSFGASCHGRKVGTIGDATTASFFPAKPLGCYGDGGAVFTQDAELAALLRSLRFHGKGDDKYDNVRIGINGRLDTIQAAVLIEKLAIFEDEIAARNDVARRYGNGLSDCVETPRIANGTTSVWAQYTVRLPASKRDAVQSKLRGQGVPTQVYYPTPLHRQTAFQGAMRAGDLSVSEAASQSVLSLPMHPYLPRETQDFIIERVADAVRST
ncbi:MAG: DegT/DnrJ/EryC1/StrS aminotransferase family protein [Pseudomonadota bacterium]